MKRKITKILIMLSLFILMVACGKNGGNNSESIKIVFLPNESNESLKNSREEFAKIIEKATGKKVELITTTDYNIAIENIVSGQAQIAYIGAEAVLSASERNPDVQAVLTNAGASGTREDSLYYSFIAVNSEKAEDYKVNGQFDLEKIKGKTISFVTNTSTSGFIIPGKVIAKQFGLNGTDELLEEGKVFSKVIFGDSHPGTQVNLLKNDVDVATFAIPKSFSIYDLVSGEDNKAGATYKVRNDAVAPFGEYAGKSFTVIKSIPVLNGAITFNVKSFAKEDQDKIKQALMSKETTDNPAIFGTKESQVKGIRGLFAKHNENVGFVEVDNKWYEQIRNY